MYDKPVTGFTSESPNKQFVILADSGKCENLLEALEIRKKAGYRVVQCWGSGAAQGLLGTTGNMTTYVLLEKAD